MHKFNNASKSYLQHNRLQVAAANILFEMLPSSSNKILDLGSGPGVCLNKLSKKYPKALTIGCDLSLELCKLAKNNVVVANANNLPFASNQFDLIYSNMLLQWLPELEHTLKGLWQVSSYDGEIIASTLGPSSLQEARAALSTIDRANNINDFLDMHTIGDLLHKCNWQEIYVASEHVQLKFERALDVFLNLKYTGANTMLNPSANRKSLGKNTLKSMLENYPKTNNEIIATFEIITIRAKKKLPNNQINPNTILRT